MNWYVVDFEGQYVALGTAHRWEGEVAAACTSYWAALAAQRLLAGRCRRALAGG